MTNKEFEDCVADGIRSLPLWVHEELENIVFLVSEEPTKVQRKENGLTPEETLFGIYEGVPLSERGNNPPVLPDTITLFRKPILERYSKEEDVRTCVQNTIWHEVAHYFGYGEEWVENEERKRGKFL